MAYLILNGFTCKCGRREHQEYHFLPNELNAATTLAKEWAKKNRNPHLYAVLGPGKFKTVFNWRKRPRKKAA